MRIARTLYALAAVALAAPALGADVSYRDAASEKKATTPSETAKVADSARPQASNCQCPSMQHPKGAAK